MILPWDTKLFCVFNWQNPALQPSAAHQTLGLLHRRGEAAGRSECQDRGSFKQNFSLGSPRRISKGKQDLVHWCVCVCVCRELSVNSCKPRLLAADNRSVHSAWPLMHGKSKIEICLERQREQKNPNLQ